MAFNLSLILVYQILLTILHPYYVSVTEVTYNKKANLVEITSKIFTDDFERILSQNYDTKVDLINPVNKEKNEELIEDYLRKNLRLTFNKKGVSFRLLGYEIEEDAVWSYAEASFNEIPRIVEIKNSLLFDYKKEQLNLMHITIEGKRQSTKFQNPESTASMKF